MSRRRIAAVLALAACLLPPAAFAQDGASGSPPERIDLSVTAAPVSQANEEECRRRREAAIVSNEIIVCGAVPTENQRITSRGDAQDRYAARTMGATTPDVAGAGIFRGPATFSGLCVPGIFNCPKPPALMVDVANLPQAPPDSDADRIARGLAPLGESNEAIVSRQMSAAQRAELGLPVPAPETGPNPAESAAPAGPR